MNKLLQEMRQITNYTRTENGAITNKSTLSDLLDYYYHAPAMRGKDTTQLFSKAYSEDAKLAIKTAFYIRDIRGGSNIGERETFRQALDWLYINKPTVFDAIIPAIAEYGRWDDMLKYVDNVLVRKYIAGQFNVDMQQARQDKPVSLLAKWMPSENTSSQETRALARKWIEALETTPRMYRKSLVFLRKKLKLVETLMSAGKFDAIDYASVPSRASMIYRKAFGKQDTDRYVQYLKSVEKGETKINATNLYPYELVRKYLDGHPYDQTLELQWSSLPNYADSDVNAIVMADVSSSMSGRPMEVSISLAIYFAERNKGSFKDYFMTFSGNPSLEKVKGVTLREKVWNVSSANWNMNTNIQAAFDLILTTAKRTNATQDEMPRMLFIISDMQFDSSNVGGKSTNFDTIKRKYAAAGYTMPTLVFWNVDSRNTETPVTQYEENVFLVSGFSAGVFKSAIQAKATNPMDMMLEVLNSDRYDRLDILLDGIV